MNNNNINNKNINNNQINVNNKKNNCDGLSNFVDKIIIFQNLKEIICNILFQNIIEEKRISKIEFVFFNFLIFRNKDLNDILYI